MPEDVAKPDLSVLTREELWTELSSRFTNAVMIYECPDKVKKDVDVLGLWWNDVPLVSLSGLVGYAQARVDMRFKNMMDAPADEM